jgi:threonine dehydrogenase-like Zn-dependent dehydrogenase
MIVKHTDRGVLSLSGELLPACIAYVDREWIVAARDQPVQALLADQGDDPTSEILGIARLVALARRALDVVGELGPVNGVEVIGDGLVARCAKRLWGRDAPAEGPGAIIDTTGDPDAIADATRRLCDMGTLVLAGETPGAVALDLYPDVHVRGLRLVGVSANRLEPSPADAMIAVEVATEVATVTVGTPLPDAPAYRIVP